MAVVKKYVKPQNLHSGTGASSMERWENCPGSVRLVKQMPEVESIYANEGTKAHELAEYRLKNARWPQNHQIEYPQEMIDAVEVYVNYVEAKSKILSRNSESKRMLEYKFHVPSMHEGFRGTADCAIYDGDTKHLEIVDYKHGAGVEVSPEKNTQLMYYAIGTMLSLRKKVDLITMTIVQPRFSGGEPIKSWEIEYDDLLEFGVRIIDAIKKTEEENPELKTGDHCRWCNAKPICPKLREEAEIAVKEEFAVSALANLDQDSIGMLLSKLDVVEEWVKGVREFGYQQAKLGNMPTGFKLVPKRAVRKWANPVEAIKKFESVFSSHVIRDLMTDPELKTPAQVEKVLGKEHKELMDSLIVAISSGDTLVPDSDKRRSIDKKQIVNQMFGDN